MSLLASTTKMKTPLQVASGVTPSGRAEESSNKKLSHAKLIVKNESLDNTDVEINIITDLESPESANDRQEDTIMIY